MKRANIIFDKEFVANQIGQTPYTYSCDIYDACYSGFDSNKAPICASTYWSSITVSDQPVVITITLPGNDTRLEPPNPDRGLIYSAARSQLPGLVEVSKKNPDNNEKSIPISQVTRCDGSPGNWGPCL